MQSARESSPGPATAAPRPRAAAMNRTLVWFSGDAERRRRAAAVAQEALARRAATELGWVGLYDRSYDEIRRRAQARRAAHLTALFRRGVALLSALPIRSAAPASGASAPAAAVWPRPAAFGYVALAALVLAMVGGPALNTAGLPTCRTEPAVLASGTDVDVKMTVARNAACAISAKGVNVPVIDLETAVPPRHGMLTLRGRTGVTYRPAREFTGEDSFSFALRGAPAGRGGASLVRVNVSVKR